MDVEENNDKDLENEELSKARHDENSAYYLKPIIKELVRTQVCFPNIKLLVDKISIVQIPSPTDSSPLEAYRMHLTDREKTIQAVVKRRLHKWLTTYDVREGSYVILKEYNLAKAKRLRGEGEVFYLAISDFYSIGEEQRYDAGMHLEDISATAAEGDADPQEQESARDENEGNEVGIVRVERSLPRGDSANSHIDNASNEHLFPSKMAIIDTKKRKRRRPSPDLIADSLSHAGKTDKFGDTPAAKMTRGQGYNSGQSRLSDHYIPKASASEIPVQREVFSQAQVPPEQCPSPLQLSTLASITGTNASRNKQVNILVMIEYVSSSTVKPTTAPLKRDVRIVDPSTDKKVILSVFIDPVNFIPKKYDIILFRDLTTHDFSGGNLNAYPKKCRGKEWYIVNPYDIEECDMGSMEEFRAKYIKAKAKESG